MNEKVFPLLSYLRYWLKKEDKYSLQSPGIFSLYEDLFRFLQTRKSLDLDIEAHRAELLRNHQTIQVLDLGAGSKKIKSPVRKISEVTRYSSTSRKHAQLLQYFCSLTRAKNVIELGTCLGITTRYLSKMTHGKLFTFEASAQLLSKAKEGWKATHVDFVEGDIRQTLPEKILDLDEVDFAFIDANHTYSGTLFSYNQLSKKIAEQGIIAIGDIHWSEEMEKAWNEIKSRPEIKLSLDFYEVGILIFEFPGRKSEYILEF